MNLNQLIALKKAQTEKSKDDTAIIPEPAGNESPTARNESVDAGAGKPVEIPRESEAAPNPATAKPAATGGLKLNFGGNKSKPVGTGSPSGVLPASDRGTQIPVRNNPIVEPKRTNGIELDSRIDDGAGFSLDDLASLDADSIDAPQQSRFDDEIPADAPVRDVPEGMDSSARSFVENLDSLYAMFGDVEFFGSIVRNIMQELTANPEYEKLMADQDIHVMMRGMRESMGMARIKKQEAKAKRAPKGSKTVKQSEADELLASLGADFGGD